MKWFMLFTVFIFCCIQYNASLTTLEGLENIDDASITDLSINGNPMLSDCEAENICEYLANPNGEVDIYDNALGCEGVIQLVNACSIYLDCLPYGNYHFQSQSDIDAFTEYFPDCEELSGSLTIIGVEITSLEGLINVRSIEGDMYIENNIQLQDLSGLENMKSIMGDLSISVNSALMNLSGLNNVTTIGGSLVIANNWELREVTDLYNLQQIEDRIWIWYNPFLTSLEGLDNADLGSLSDLQIMYNERLSTCDILSICGYLSGNTDTTNQILFKYTLPSDSPVLIKIYDRMGREVATLVDQNQPKGTFIVEFVNTRLAAGIYLSVLETNTGKQTVKQLKVTGQ